MRHEQGDDDDHEEDRVDVVGLAPVPHDRLLDDAEQDRGAGDDRQPLHPTDDRGRERAQQDHGPEHLADGEADDPGAEVDGQEREQRRP